MGSDARTVTERIARPALIVVATLVFIFLVAPILAILPLSVNDSEFLTYPMRGFTWRWYETVFSSEKWRLAVWNSFLIGIPATLIATVLGTLAAIGPVDRGLPRQGLRHGAAPLAAGRADRDRCRGALLLLCAARPDPVLSRPHHRHAALGAPFVVVTVGAALASFDRNLARAAASLGAPPLTVFFRIVFRWCVRA